MLNAVVTRPMKRGEFGDVCTISLSLGFECSLYCKESEHGSAHDGSIIPNSSKAGVSNIQSIINSWFTSAICVENKTLP